jgi:hypothetical protein
MSLETALSENTAALKAHTAALLAAPGIAGKQGNKAIEVAPKPEKPKAEKPAAKEAGLDYETQVKPKVIATAKAKGRVAVDNMLMENFKVTSAKEVKPEDYQKLVDLIDALNAEEDVA